MTLPRHNLPKRASHFIGRERDVTDLRRLFGSTRMITLTGAGGIGKTRLAVRVAEDVLTQFDDARFVDISEAVAPGAAVRAVADALRVVEERETDLPEAICTALRPQRFLLVLDTCERAVGVLAELCTRLLSTCPGVQILATSREPLRIPGETIWRVPPLSVPARPTGPQMSMLRPPETPEPVEPAVPGTGLRPQEALRYEAVRLFVVRAGSARPGFEVNRETLGQVVEVCRILDGVPLAIELAAARVRVLSVRQILSRLDDRFRLLVGNERDLPARQRTIRATVEWSHDLLSENEQILLRRLSVFSTWTMKMAEQICGYGAVSAEEVLDLHASLLDKSLIVTGPEVGKRAHYHLLDTVRAYAAERLAASGEEEEHRDRHLTAAVESLEEANAQAGQAMAWPERLGVLRRVDHHRENIRRLLSWARGRRPLDGLRFCVAMRPYWLVRDSSAEAVSLLRGFLDEAAAEPPTPVRARGLALYAELTFDSGAPDAARLAAAEALKVAGACEGDAALAAASFALAQLGAHASDTDSGRAQAREALDLAAQSGDLFAEILALNVLGIIESAHDPAAARAHFEQSLAASERISSLWSSARSRTLIAVLDAADAPKRAAAELTTALGVFEELGSARDAARCCAALGRLAVQQGDLAEARDRLTDALRCSVASGRRLPIARALEALGELAAAERQFERAASLAGAADALRTALRRPGGSGSRLRALAESELGPAATQIRWHAWRSLALEHIINEALALPPTRPSAPLTPRELEIAQLVGAGMSNRAIAEQLTITSATAARHIANIFGKLDFTSRAQLAEWASTRRD